MREDGAEWVYELRIPETVEIGRRPRVDLATQLADQPAEVLAALAVVFGVRPTLQVELGGPIEFAQGADEGTANLTALMKEVGEISLVAPSAAELADIIEGAETVDRSEWLLNEGTPP